MTFSCVTAACNISFRISKGRKLKTRTLPWWNDELKILLKKVNASRRRYQRTLDNEDLRHERKLQYNEGKRQYQSKLQEKNLNHGKITAPQLKSRTLGTQFTNRVWEIKKYNLLNNSPTARWDLYLGCRKHNKAYVRLFCSRRQGNK